MKSILLTRLTACELEVTTVVLQLFFHFIIHLQKKRKKIVFQVTPCVSSLIRMVFS